MSRVLTTSNGVPVSEGNPLPVKVQGGVGGVDPDNFYTKEESDERFQTKGDYATTEQLNALIARIEELENPTE